MTDVVKDRIKKYASSNMKSVYALRDWLTINMKQFTLMDAFECIYLFTGGDFDKMTKVIRQLTEKKKVFGRTHVYDNNEIKDIDIVKGENGKLELRGYNPNKEPVAKGQHIQRNHRIFRKSDGQINRNYQRSEDKMMDFGQQVRELYPDKSNQYITHAMIAIKKYSDFRKINPARVIKSIKNGRLILKDSDLNSFKVVPVSNESRVIVISENQVIELNEEFEMTEYKFYNNIKKFLSDLLADPINAQPTFLLNKYGFTRSRLIRKLIDIGLLDNKERISDKDENGEPKTATMLVKYKVPKKDFKKKLRRLWIRLFERNVPERKKKAIDTTNETMLTNLNEEGEGATSADASGEFSQPLFSIQRRKMPVEVEEATTTTTAGDYEYDVPFGGDEETLARKNGVGGSVSVNIE